MAEFFVTIIPKGRAVKTQVKNYRTISLLNTNYKKISKVLTERIKPHLEKLIHTDQQCAAKGRKTQHHLHNLRDTITYCQDKDINGYIISIDQEQAFDRVEHKYLHNILEMNNIGNYSKKWIKIIYAKPTSRIIFNQDLTDPFPITNFVRQGCSLSPLLYVLTLEPA